MYRKDQVDVAFLERELNHVMVTAYDRRYPDLIGRQLIHVNTEVAAGMKTFTWKEYDRVGIAQLVSSDGTDMPMADVSGVEYSGKIDYYQLGYKYDLMEILAAQNANRPLDVQKATAARLGHETRIDQGIFFGDPVTGMKGMLNQPNAQDYTIPQGDSGHTQWVQKTADEIIADVNGAINKVKGASDNVYSVNTVLLPVEQYAHIASIPRSTRSDTTVLEFLQKVHPGVRFVESWRCKGAGEAKSDRMLAYNDSPDVADFILAMEFRQEPGQWDGIIHKVPCLSGFGGVRLIHPLSWCYADGI